MPAGHKSGVNLDAWLLRQQRDAREVELMKARAMQDEQLALVLRLMVERRAFLASLPKDDR